MRLIYPYKYVEPLLIQSGNSNYSKKAKFLNCALFFFTPEVRTGRVVLGPVQSAVHALGGVSCVSTLVGRACPSPVVRVQDVRADLPSSAACLGACL